MKKVLVLGIILALVLCLAACGGDKDSEATPSPEATPQVTAAPTETPEEKTSEVEGAMDIETDYATLYYPEQWKETVETKTEANTVEFFATVGQHENVHIFDIIFGGEEGYCIGTVEKDGVTVEVNVRSIEVATDSSWTEEELNTLRSMQEDVNFLAEALK